MQHVRNPRKVCPVVGAGAFKRSLKLIINDNTIILDDDLIRQSMSQIHIIISAHLPGCYVQQVLVLAAATNFQHTVNFQNYFWIFVSVVCPYILYKYSCISLQVSYPCKSSLKLKKYEQACKPKIFWISWFCS